MVGKGFEVGGAVSGGFPRGVVRFGVCVRESPEGVPWDLSVGPEAGAAGGGGFRVSCGV